VESIPRYSLGLYVKDIKARDMRMQNSNNTELNVRHKHIKTMEILTDFTEMFSYPFLSNNEVKA